MKNSEQVAFYRKVSVLVKLTLNSFTKCYIGEIYKEQ
jgi:hypothetical protein